MTKTACTVDGCETPMIARGWCQKHYSRWASHGSTDDIEVATRDYPDEIVKRVRELYESGMTISEVQEQIGHGYKVQVIMRRYKIQPRRRGARDQWGEKHPQWKGSQASYASLHERVVRLRGNARECSWCGNADPDYRYEWANISGAYDDVNDYVRLCVRCHRQYDASRRAETGQSTCVGWR